MHLADEVEVDEAVVHRRDQRVGLEDRRAGNRVVAAGRVDDDHVGCSRKPLDRGAEAFLALVVETS